jgi:hypothetical protein
MSRWATVDDPIRLGSMLFTLVEPRAGHEVAYNRWYERDHFYAGCMVGPFQFTGQRFVPTRDLKARSHPTGSSPITPDPSIGSYHAVYWVLAGHHDEWSRWAVDQVTMLHATGRMFPERDHIHTALYDYEWGVFRDGEDGVSAELALDHRFPGMAAVVVEGDDGPALDRWLREEHLPGALAGSPIAMCLSFSPIPLLGDAPSDVPRQEGSDRRFLHLYFLDAPALAEWSRFERLGDDVKGSGLGEVVWASPFLPTIPGTDTYADQLH